MKNKLTKLLYTIIESLNKWQVKVLLAFLSFLVIAVLLFYAKTLVDELIEREKKNVVFYADVIEHYVKLPNSNSEDLLFFVDRIPTIVSFPMVFTNEFDVPNYPYNQFSLNIPIDTTQSDSIIKQMLIAEITTMRATYNPIFIKDNDGKVISKIYYTHSALVNSLRLLPYIELIIVIAFVFMGYVAFSYLRRSEQSRVWVGMAKEAAHQLGTPLSSLLAWLEILKQSRYEEELFDTTIGEMERDIARLNTIAIRFSKIGSKPELREENVSLIVTEVVDYYQKRIPGVKDIQFEKSIQTDVYGYANHDLLSWVFENLCKNAIEAIEKKQGTISVTLTKINNKAIVLFSDTGKGMTSSVKRQAFTPGFSTKKRGWGIGLSLSKRIIEEYHKGKIIIKESTPKKGTSFYLEIPLLQQIDSK
jgi:signal transduction histidine kinase